MWGPVHGAIVLLENPAPLGQKSCAQVRPGSSRNLLGLGWDVEARQSQGPG